MIKIDSGDNPKIKHLDKINKQKKYRQLSGEFVVENWVMISDAQESGYQYEALFATEEFIQKHKIFGDYYIVSESLNKKYSNLDTPSGVAAIYKIKDCPLEKGPIIYLNAISDPGNLGTILRSALAFGFKNIVLDKNCVDLYGYKVLLAAKDAIFKLNILEDRGGDFIKNNKLPLYSTSSHVGKDLSNIKLLKDFCLVLGSESHGVDEKIIKQSQENIKIEMTGNIESLNVATAAAIILYEFRR